MISIVHNVTELYYNFVMEEYFNFLVVPAIAVFTIYLIYRIVGVYHE